MKGPVGVWSAGRDESPAAITGGFWLGFTRWSSGQLVASHLRSPALFTVQLDHLLSSVRSVDHNRRHEWRQICDPAGGRNRGNFVIAAIRPASA